MPVRVPTLSGIPYPPAVLRTRQASIDVLVDFLANGQTLVLTGAGVSVDSGIRSYRGKEGSYNDTTKLHRPIFYGEFVASEAMRRRYWARSYLGFPAVRVAEPNPTHYAIAALQKLGLATKLITQNVDGLHHKAIDSSFDTYLNSPSTPATAPPLPDLSLPSSISPILSSLPPSPPSTLPTSLADPPILELHGTLRHAHCLKCQDVVGRDAFQDRLSLLNPDCAEYADQVSKGSREERLNPDGDVELGSGVRYEEFFVPECDKCGGPMKPKVTFFGESLSPVVRDMSKQWVTESKQLLILGSSLATFSAFRLVRQKREEGGEVLLLNVGESRGDAAATERIGWAGGAGEIVPEAARELLRRRIQTSQLSPETIIEIETMFRSGVVKSVERNGFSTS